MKCFRLQFKTITLRNRNFQLCKHFVFTRNNWHLTYVLKKKEVKYIAVQAKYLKSSMTPEV